MTAGLIIYGQPQPGASCIICGTRAHLQRLRDAIDCALTSPGHGAMTWFPDPTRERYAVVVAEVDEQHLLKARPHFTDPTFQNQDGVDPAELPPVRSAVQAARGA